MNLNNIHHFSIWSLRFNRSLGKIIYNCTPHKTINWDFELINNKFVNKYRKTIYTFFINKMKEIWLNDYYLSMDPND